jgi:hypothetical protein
VGCRETKRKEKSTELLEFTMISVTADRVAVRTQGMNVFLASVWFLYLVLKPVYLLPQGLPQLSDVILLFGIVPAMISIFMQAGARVSLVVLTGGLFAALTCFINLINYSFYPDTKLILSSLYNIYNFMIFLFAVYLFRRDAARTSRISIIAITISIFVQIISIKLFPDFDAGTERLTGGFANPNQLAYWALLSASMLVFLSKRMGLIDFAAIGMAGYLQTVALSKAGLITFGLFMLLLIFLPQVPRAAKMILLFLLMMSISYFSFSRDYHFDAAQKVSTRLESIGAEADDSLAGRGYDRLVQRPEYMLFGAGEGGFERFRQWGGPDELHSGLATILFSYGILGLGFFGAFLFFIFNRQPWYCVALLLIVLMFSVTSQTIRFTHTWVFLGIAYGSFVSRREEEASRRGALPANPAPQSG